MFSSTHGLAQNSSAVSLHTHTHTHINIATINNRALNYAHRLKTWTLPALSTVLSLLLILTNVYVTIATKWSHQKWDLGLTTFDITAHPRVTSNPPWPVILTCKLVKILLHCMYQADICNGFKVIVHTHTPLPNESYIHAFMIIIWQSSQIWKIRDASDRHTLLKTILPRCYVVAITNNTTGSAYHHSATWLWFLSTFIIKLLMRHFTLLTQQQICHCTERTICYIILYSSR